MLDRVKKLLEPEVSLNAKLIGVSIYFGKMFESITDRLVSLEARQLEKGERGEKGDKGSPGEPGPKGDVGPQGLQGLVGPEGKPGKDGKDGKTGKAGASVVEADIAADNHLVFKLSNGSLIDAGELPIKNTDAVYNTQVAQDQITVSATAPSSPYLNQLWLDIS